MWGSTVPESFRICLHYLFALWPITPFLRVVGWHVRIPPNLQKKKNIETSFFVK